MDAMVEALKPFIIFAMVLWGIETVVTMLIKDHKQAKRKRAREKRRLEYQDRRMANDVEHAKVTRAMRYDVLRRDDFHCVHCGRGREDGVKLHVDHIVPVSRGGDGYIHGSIVDVDWLHHIFLDPAGTVTFYYAEKKGDWKCFNSFQDLLKSKNLMFAPKRLGGETENALAQISNKTKALMPSTQEINSAAAKKTQESYARSLVVSKVSYLSKHNIIRIWNDEVMQDRTNLIQSPDNKLLNC